MDWSIAVIQTLQDQGWLYPAMSLATFLGTVEFYLIFLPALYWCRDPRLGFRVALLLVLSQGISSVLKLAFHTPRPYWVSAGVEALGSEGSFAMPSGHAQNALCTWGSLAHSRQGQMAWIGAFTLAFLTGISRIYMGVHFPGDVLAGWALGILILVAYVRWEAGLSRSMAALSLKGQILISTLVSAALLVLTFSALSGLEGWQVPGAWAENALAASGRVIAPLDPESALESAGMVLGMAAGYAALSRNGGFEAGGSRKLLAARYILGMAVLAYIWYAAGPAFSFMGPWEAYLRAALAGAWVSAGAPALFMTVEKRLGPGP